MKHFEINSASFTNATIVLRPSFGKYKNSKKSLFFKLNVTTVILWLFGRKLTVTTDHCEVPRWHERAW